MITLLLLHRLDSGVAGIAGIAGIAAPGRFLCSCMYSVK